ncbi:MAG TPA: type II secretion system F family protein [Paraburkholderia sp.]|jgi:tight adherence protein B
MASTVALVAALALLCAAAALWFAQRGAQRSGRMSTERFIDSRMASAAQAGAGAARGAPASASAAGAHGAAAQKVPHAPRAGTGAGAGTGVGAGPRNAASTGKTLEARWRMLHARAAFAFDSAMSRAGIAHARMPVLAATLAMLVLCGLAGHYAGVPAACAVFVACALGLYVLVSWRMRKRRALIVRQLPSFLDGIVRLVVIGNSVPAAFQAALQTTEAPLRECLDHVSRMLRTGVEIDRALQHVAQVYRTSELALVGAVLRLSVKYGGRADMMLDRMASFMRDLEQAERELSAMSAETRMSSWVLALLPIGIGGFLIVSTPHYFASMWNDVMGRKLVYLAFSLQAVGVLLLYRLARLRG